MKCSATTLAGDPCKNDARDEEGLCPIHAGDQKVGRHTKLTPERQAKIVQAIRANNVVIKACQYADISEPTYYDWKKRGETGEEPFSEFLKAIKKAEAEAQVRTVAIISKASEQSWQAGAWLLERRDPDNWGKKERYDVSHEVRVLQVEFVSPEDGDEDQ